MGTYTLTLGRIDDAEMALAGGKGASLARLISAGFPVPPGFVVTTTAYADAIDAAGLPGADPEQMRQQIPSMPVPEQLETQVAEAYRQLGAPRVAVRSSGTAEDLADASFAGQHDTFLNVTGEQSVIAAVRDCWASLWTPRAVAYRQRYGRYEGGLSLAVVVQVMVDAEWAGVLFTCDPVTGRRDQMVVEAVPGLGEALVSGETSGRRHVIDKTTGAKVGGESDEPPGDVLQELGKLGAGAERTFGGPQDIEWAYDGAHAFLVQARPLTALGEEPGTASPAVSAERPYAKLPGVAAQQAADHLPYPPFPIDVSLVYRPTVSFVIGLFRSLGFATPDVDDMLVEIDDGVVQVFPPKLRPQPRIAVRIPVAAFKLVAANRSGLTGWLERHGSRLSSLVRRADTDDLSTVPDSELLDRVKMLQQALGEFAQGRFLRAPRGALAEGVLAGLLRLAAGERGAQLHADLLADVPTVTAAGNRELDRLAGIIRESPELRELYAETEPERVAQRLRETAGGLALLDGVATFLQRYGCRELSIPTVGYPYLREEPAIVHGLLAKLAAGQRVAADPERSDRARSAITTAPDLRTRVLGGLALRSLDGAREFVAFREDSHYLLFMPLAAIRRLLLELGERLVRRETLAEVGDIFYLGMDEITVADASRTRDVVAWRKAARAAALGHYTPVPAELLQRANTADAVHGTPAARGSAVGQVRVVRDETDFPRLGHGEVLVCAYTNPTWTPLFSLASAVVVDAGGMGSHAAVVAREYGIPAVMGTGNATHLLRDGQRVLVNGTEGTVVPVGDAASVEVDGVPGTGGMGAQGG